MRLLIFCGVYAALFVYPWLRLTTELTPQFSAPPWAVTALMVLLVTTPWVLWTLSRRIEPPARYWVARTVYVWLGVSWILFILSLPWELVYLVASDHRDTAAWALVALTALVAARAFVGGNLLTVRTVQIPIKGLTSTVRAVQLSDVHVGSRSPRFLARAVAAANALEPDVVFITGDLIDGRAVPEHELRSLSTFSAPCVFAIGNHERYVDCDAICERLRNLGVQVLRNETAVVEAGSERFCVAGIDDADDTKQVSRHLPALTFAPECPRILLYHRPDGLEDAAAHDIDMMLCGHTHNGQLIPFNWLVKKRFPRILGLYEHDQTVMYVSPGTGTWGPPMRLGSANEVTLLELIPAQP